MIYWINTGRHDADPIPALKCRELVDHSRRDGWSETLPGCRGSAPGDYCPRCQRRADWRAQGRRR